MIESIHTCACDFQCALIHLFATSMGKKMHLQFFFQHTARQCMCSHYNAWVQMLEVHYWYTIYKKGNVGLNKNLFIFISFGHVWI